MKLFVLCTIFLPLAEAKSKLKHGVWNPMSELTITLPRVDSNTFIMDNPMSESTLILRQSRLYPPSQGLWICTQLSSNNVSIQLASASSLFPLPLLHLSMYIRSSSLPAFRFVFFVPSSPSFLILYQHFFLLLSSFIFHILPPPFTLGILSGVFLTACFGEEGAYRSNGRHLSPLILSRGEFLILCSRESPLSILYLSSIYPLSILYLSSIYPLSILYLSSIYPLPILYLSSIHPLSILYLSSTYPLSILYLSSTYPLPILYLSSIYPQPILYLSSIYPLSILYLSSIYPRSSFTNLILPIFPAPPPIRPQQPIDGWLRRKMEGSEERWVAQ